MPNPEPKGRRLFVAVGSLLLLFGLGGGCWHKYFSEAGHDTRRYAPWNEPNSFEEPEQAALALRRYFTEHAPFWVASALGFLLLYLGCRASKKTDQRQTSKSADESLDRRDAEEP